jgi:hypothetical protein
MTFPFESLVAEHRELGLVVETLIGFGFGYTLERAGFGRAQKLAAQFYGTDMTVLKVMFSAIVTGMIGLVVASGLGLADFKAVADSAASSTYLWPMIVGGFALGVGFIVSGYCPGTSWVATASGKLDGLATVVGVVVGQVVYAELEWRPFLKGFHESGDLGNLYLWELLHLPPRIGPAVVAVAVAAMALAAFLGAEKLEKALAARADPAAQASPAGRPGRVVFAGFATAAILGAVLLALPTGSQARSREAPSISQMELARRVLDEPWKVRVIDLRDMKECAARRIPGSECVPAEKLGSLRLADSSPSRDVVLVAAEGLGAVPAPAAGFPGRLYVLAGGFKGWEAFALTAPAAPASGASPEAIEEYRLRAGLNSAMTGMKAAPPPPPPAAAPSGPRKGGGGCGG